MATLAPTDAGESAMKVQPPKTVYAAVPGDLWRAGRVAECLPPPRVYTKWVLQTALESHGEASTHIYRQVPAIGTILCIAYRADSEEQPVHWEARPVVSAAAPNI